MNKISGIYKIQSKSKPDRIYIGSSIDIEVRWRNHLFHLKRNTHHSRKLQNHYNKYGKTDLEFSILICCDKDSLLCTEQFYIDSHKTYFNICRKAGSCYGIKRSNKFISNLSKRTGKMNPMHGKSHSEESKLKMKYKAVESWKTRKPISEEVRQKMNINNKGTTGWIPSEEWKENQSRIHLEHKASDKTKKKMSESHKKNKSILLHNISDN